MCGEDLKIVSKVRDTLVGSEGVANASLSGEDI